MTTPTTITARRKAATAKLSPDPTWSFSPMAALRPSPTPPMITTDTSPRSPTKATPSTPSTNPPTKLLLTPPQPTPPQLTLPQPTPLNIKNMILNCDYKLII